jgi:hypothetical protein
MADYFSHDYNSRQDPKIAALIGQFGYEGYGIWWAFVEVLHEQGGKIEKFPKLFDGLARVLSTNEALLKQIISASICELHLLKEDETHIWSERVLRNFQEREDKRLKKVEAGRKGGILSGESRGKMGSKTKQGLKQKEANEAKERKGKESICGFTKPTPTEVTDYAKSIGYGLDGEYFCSVNDSKGWLVGKTKTPMKDWRAVVRTWKANQSKFDAEQKPEAASW